MLSQAGARRIRALQVRKNRERDGLFVAEGVRVVEDLLDSGLPLREVVVAPSAEDSPRGRALVVRAAGAARVLRTTDAVLKKIAGTDSPQGILAVAPIPARSLDSVVPRSPGAVLVLDGVQDPGNLGTLIRTADAFDAAAVIALHGTVDCWNPKVVRAAAGSLFRLPVIYVTAQAAGAWLAQHEVHVYAADAQGADVDAGEPAARVAVIVGNEGAGLSADARALADETVAVRMPGRAESLNVAVAAGILLHAFTRQRS